MGLFKKKDATAEASAPEPPRRASHQRMFLGVLQSDMDTSVELPEVFDRMQRRYQQLMQAYINSQIGPHTLATNLRELVHEDAGGQEWTIGATSGQWYRRLPGTDWVASPPPVGVDPGEELGTADIDTDVDVDDYQHNFDDSAWG